MTEEPNREKLLAEYAKQPVRQYSQVDVFVDQGLGVLDLPDDMRCGLGIKQLVILAAVVFIVVRSLL